MNGMKDTDGAIRSYLAAQTYRGRQRDAEEAKAEAHAEAPAVVVGVDGSEPALGAVRWAAGEAARRNVALRLLHVCDVPPMSARVRDSGPYDHEQPLLSSAQDWIDAAAEVATQVEPGLEVHREIRTGGAARVLVEASDTAGLLVLGTRGLSGFRGLLVGSVAASVAGHGRCPVVVVPAKAASGEAGPVVVGADGSDASEPVLEFAFEAAASRATELVAVRAWRDPAADDAWAGLPPRSATEAMLDRQRSELRQNLAGWRAKHPDVDVREVVVRATRPIDPLLETASGAQLVVVGSHARSRLGGILLGSTSRLLLHNAACPVAVVPGELR